MFRHELSQFKDKYHFKWLQCKHIKYIVISFEKPENFKYMSRNTTIYF